jgi:hypothetical protein
MSGKWETVPLINTRHPVIVHLIPPIRPRARH